MINETRHPVLTSQTPDAPTRFQVLDSMRGICACMIVLLHFATQGIIFNSQFVKNGFLFVDFFFVLSGFVIAASYGDRLAQGYSPTAFMILRWGRIYPLHLVMLMAFLVFEVGYAVAGQHDGSRMPFSGNYQQASLLTSALLIQIFFGKDMVFWNGPSWSIAAEIWTYLLFAGLFRFARHWLVPSALLIALASCLYLSVLTDRFIEVFHDGALVRCLYGFSLGVTAYRLHKRIPTMRVRHSINWLSTFIETLTIVAVCFAVYHAGPTIFSLALPPIFLIAILVFAREAGLVSRLLMLKPFLVVGTLSYSIYMTHLFLELRFVNFLSAMSHIIHQPLVMSIDDHNRVGLSPLFGDVMSLTMLAIVVAFAGLTYRWIEKPAQQWSRRWVAERYHRPVAAPESSAPTF